MFPDPEAYNPMRWLDPAYSTFKEDLTVHPTITQYSQFGYGRRVCQGQEVTEADMFVGVGAMAWLFNISKDDPNSDADSAYESGADESLEQDDQFRMDKKPGISVNTGIETPPDEKSIEVCLSTSWGASALKSGLEDVSPIPGTFPTWATESESRLKQIQTPPPTPSEPRKPEGLTQSLESIRANGNIPEPTITSRSAPSDPTLAFSPLLIAKPYPFKFSMRIRNADRAAFARREYEKLRQEGEFPDEKVYWNGGTAGDEMYGWGKV
ncbi:MAG: hypothetical protein Q9157_002515 [Trypethelium eluteriae]